METAANITGVIREPARRPNPEGGRMRSPWPPFMADLCFKRGKQNLLENGELQLSKTHDKRKRGGGWSLGILSWVLASVVVRRKRALLSGAPRKIYRDAWRHNGYLAERKG